MPESYNRFELVIQLPEDVHLRLANHAQLNGRPIGDEILSQLERVADLEFVTQAHDEFMEKLRDLLRNEVDLSSKERDRSSDH